MSNDTKVAAVRIKVASVITNYVVELSRDVSDGKLTIDQVDKALAGYDDFNHVWWEYFRDDLVGEDD